MAEIDLEHTKLLASSWVSIPSAMVRTPSCRATHTMAEATWLVAALVPSAWMNSLSIWPGAAAAPPRRLSAVLTRKPYPEGQRRGERDEILPGPEALFVLGLIVVIPAVLARLFVATGWLQVVCAFLLWWAALFILLGGGSVSRDEGLGWTLIMSMFFGWAGVPLSALILRAANVPYRFL